MRPLLRRGDILQGYWEQLLKVEYKATILMDTNEKWDTNDTLTSIPFISQVYIRSSTR